MLTEGVSIRLRHARTHAIKQRSLPWWWTLVSRRLSRASFSVELSDTAVLAGLSRINWMWT